MTVRIKLFVKLQNVGQRGRLQPHRADGKAPTLAQADKTAERIRLHIPRPKGMGKKFKGAGGGNGGVFLAQGACRRVAGVGKNAFPGLLLFLVEDFQIFFILINLPYDLFAAVFS